MSLVPSSSSIETGGSYTLSRSLRFRSSASAYLSRTPASDTSSNKKGTFSCWMKLGALASGTNNGTFIGAADNYHYGQFFNNTLYFGNTSSWINTPGVYRDYSAWYHVLFVFDTTQATAANRLAIYVNGVLQSAGGTTSYPTQNSSFVFLNTAQEYDIARRAAGNYFDGYLAEVNFIDGQALTPSSFGQTDATTGVWVPKKYTGTYGTNGFYLPFTDNTSATTLAYDSSGNGNNWTANNISTTAGVTYDSMTDVPTLTSATAANFAVLNPLNPSTYKTESNGNLTSTGNTSTDNGLSICSMGVSSGKWVWEATIGTVVSSDPTVGITATIPANGNGKSVLELTTSALYRSSGSIYKNTSLVATSSALVANDVVRFELNMDALTCAVYVNNVLKYTFTSLTAGTYFPCAPVYNGSVVNFNFGQRPFVNTPNSGFLALNTFNLPDSSIKKGNQYMDATLYTGNGTDNRTITSTLTPDMVWIKARSTTGSNYVFDSVRGTGKYVATNYTDQENWAGNLYPNSGVTTNGFIVDGLSNNGINNNGATFVGWNWKAGGTSSSNTSGSITSTVSVNTTAGFSVVTYTGNGSAGATVGHGLGVAPKFYVVKTRSIASPNYGWDAYHVSLGATKFITLNSAAAASTSTGFWNDTAPTSSVFSIGNDWDVNKSTVTYVAYCWTEIAGFSKFGSYTGNGSADGPFVYCGFRPKFIMVKNTTAAGNGWIMYDTSRNTYNIVNYSLFANESSAENATSLTTENYFDVLSNGFKARTSNAVTNQSGQTLIYAAFAENPFKYANAR